MSSLKTEILAHHKFTFPNLGPGEGSNEQPYVRFLMFIKKHPDVSHEKFHEWWKTVHADLAVTVAGFGGHCKRYVQLHQTEEHREELKKYRMKPLEYDGIGEMYVKSLEDWIKFQSSPAFTEKLVGESNQAMLPMMMVALGLLIILGDGANFMDGKLRVMLGYDNLIFGSNVDSCGGSDGILPSDQRLTSASKPSKL